MDSVSPGTAGKRPAAQRRAADQHAQPRPADLQRRDRLRRHMLERRLDALVGHDVPAELVAVQCRKIDGFAPAPVPAPLPESPP
jgi:hypothetical protein